MEWTGLKAERNSPIHLTREMGIEFKDRERTIVREHVGRSNAGSFLVIESVAKATVSRINSGVVVKMLGRDKRVK